MFNLNKFLTMALSDTVYQFPLDFLACFGVGSEQGPHPNSTGAKPA
jgi:hypothetical protein